MWCLLLLTLPSHPNAVRLRVWRGLKALGCASLRDGAYLLPAGHAGRFAPLVATVREHGGSASLLDVTPRDAAQQQAFIAAFDRSKGYAAWRDSAQALQAQLPSHSETEARRGLRAVADALAALVDTDYCPGPALEQAEDELQSLRAALEARYSTGEPAAQPAHGIDRLEIRRFQAKRWATRKRPWIDRLACAWLIRRFVDPQARFVWLDDPAAGTGVPRGVVGFDYDGARFSHVGNRVTFEVIVASFGLDADPRLQRIARVVHYLDVGGIPAPEAAGIEAVLGGLRERHADDDALVHAAAQVFDALHAAPTAEP